MEGAKDRPEGEGTDSRDLVRLSPERQRRALELVHALANEPKGNPLADLLPFVGTLHAQSAREMEEAIEAECERVDPERW
jgi:hypothetical protein